MKVRSFLTRLHTVYSTHGAECLDQSSSRTSETFLDGESILESQSPEQPAFVRHVSKITVAKLMGVNTVADGERPMPAQLKGYSTGGKAWLPPVALSSFVIYCLHFRAERRHQEIKTVGCWIA